jgi:hypothetical protein
MGLLVGLKLPASQALKATPAFVVDDILSEKQCAHSANQPAHDKNHHG